MAKQTKSPHTRLPAGLKAAIAILAMGAAALFGGCENETAPETGQTIFQLKYGVILEDQTGQVTGMHIQIINDALDDLTSYDMQGVKIIIIAGDSVASNGNELTFGLNVFNVPENIKLGIEMFLYGYNG
jgi:hypothetical protein